MLLLRRQLDLRPVRNTSLIEIGVWSERPDEAAEIANAIAEEFRGFRMKQHETLVRESRETLEAFARVLRAIASEDPQVLHDSPLTTPVSRPDEVKAAKTPVLVWKPK